MLWVHGKLIKNWVNDVEKTLWRRPTERQRMLACCGHPCIDRGAREGIKIFLTWIWLHCNRADQALEDCQDIVYYRIYHDDPDLMDDDGESDIAKALLQALRTRQRYQQKSLQAKTTITETSHRPGRVRTLSSREVVHLGKFIKRSWKSKIKCCILSFRSLRRLHCLEVVEFLFIIIATTTVPLVHIDQ